MKRTFCILPCSIILLCLMISHGSTADRKAPVTGGKQIVAMVNNEPITSEEFGRFLANIEHEKKNSGKKAVAIDYAGILDRLIDEKLFMQEARNIGLDTLPEVMRSLAENSRRTMAQMLVRQNVKNIEVDEEELDWQYREAVKEYKLTGAVFNTESDAKEVEEELGAGGSFDDIMKRVNADGEVKETMEGKFFKNRNLLPQVTEVLSTMEPGSVSNVIEFEKGFLIMRLDDIHFPEEPEVREKMRSGLWKIARDKAIEAYIVSLIEKYAEVDQTVLDSVDYEASKEKYNKLLEDKRVIARIRKDDPVTVGDLTTAFETKLYHGTEKREKTLNRKKDEMLHEILRKRVLVHEAKKQRIDRSETFKNKIKELENSLITGLFIEKVIAPSIRLDEDELKEYYGQHTDSYVTPMMMKIDSLVFTMQKNAEDAITTLKTGTEFKWLKSNAAGQVEQDTKGILNFGGNILSVSSLPEAVQKVLSGVNSEDYRLYESEDGYFYVLNIEKVFPASPRTYQEVRNDIIKELYNKKMQEALKHWSDKLKEHYPVEIYLTEF